MGKVTVSRRAVLERIRRKLKEEGRSLRSHRRGAEQAETYYVLKGRDVSDDGITLEKLAAKLKVIEPHEELGED